MTAHQYKKNNDGRDSVAAADRQGGAAAEQMRDNRPEALKAAQLKARLDGGPTIQARGFGKFAPREDIDPDEVGEREGGIREIPEDAARPDDVPLHQEYRLAMHRLHDAILVLERANNDEVDTAALRGEMVAVQGEAKTLAKNFKKAMRNLSSDSDAETLRGNYNAGMDQLQVRLEAARGPAERVINANGYLGDSDLKAVGTEIWRDRWLRTKAAVDSAMTAVWPGQRDVLKETAKRNVGDGSPPPALEWTQRIDRERWNIFYGGSLMKGYKGPPKQSTRFLASSFDVDANMDAPGVAEYLIGVRGKTVDRGQLDPEGAGTGIEAMDAAMHTRVKREMVGADLAVNDEDAERILSEPFETRVNAPAGLGARAAAEVTRSADEQAVRDRVTKVRLTHPERMTQLEGPIRGLGLYDEETHGIVADPDRVLTVEQIAALNRIVDDVMGV